jgi:hypothetical protein
MRRAEGEDGKRASPALLYLADRPRGRPGASMRVAGATADRDAGRGVLTEPSRVAAGRQRSPSVPASMIIGRLVPARRPTMPPLSRRRLVHTIDAGMLILLTALIGSAAHAFQAPAAGDLGYDIYDIVVNKGVKGPLGFVGGVAAFLFGVSRLFSNIMIGIPTIVAAVCLIKADSILQTFGMTI